MRQTLTTLFLYVVLRAGVYVLSGCGSWFGSSQNRPGQPHMNVRSIDATDGCKTASERGNRNKRHDMADTWGDDGREDVRILSGRKKQSQRAS